MYGGIFIRNKLTKQPKRNFVNQLFILLTISLVLSQTVFFIDSAEANNYRMRYDVNTNSNVTAEQLNNYIASQVIHTERKNGTKSILRGQGQTIIDVAHKYGLNVHLFLGQIAYESGWGASTYSIQFNNLGGVQCMTGYRCASDDGTGRTVTIFNNASESIDSIGKLLREFYINQGYVDLVTISERYVNGTTLSNATTGVVFYMDAVLEIARGSGGNFMVQNGLLQPNGGIAITTIPNTSPNFNVTGLTQNPMVQEVPTPPLTIGTKLITTVDSIDKTVKVEEDNITKEKDIPYYTPEFILICEDSGVYTNRTDKVSPNPFTLPKSK